MARGHAERRSEPFDTVLVERAGVDLRRGASDETRRGVHRREPRRELGPAPEAGAIALALRLRSASVEGAPIERDRTRRADGTAVDAGAVDGDEERTVEAAV